MGIFDFLNLKKKNCEKIIKSINYSLEEINKDYSFLSKDSFEDYEIIKTHIRNLETGFETMIFEGWMVQLGKCEDLNYIVIELKKEISDLSKNVIDLLNKKKKKFYVLIQKEQKEKDSYVKKMFKKEKEYLKSMDRWEDTNELSKHLIKEDLKTKFDLDSLETQIYHDEYSLFHVINNNLEYLKN